MQTMDFLIALYFGWENVTCVMHKHQSCVGSALKLVADLTIACNFQRVQSKMHQIAPMIAPCVEDCNAISNACNNICMDQTCLIFLTHCNSSSKVIVSSCEDMQ